MYVYVYVWCVLVCACVYHSVTLVVPKNMTALSNMQVVSKSTQDNYTGVCVCVCVRMYVCIVSHMLHPSFALVTLKNDIALSLSLSLPPAVSLNLHTHTHTYTRSLTHIHTHTHTQSVKLS